MGNTFDAANKLRAKAKGASPLETPVASSARGLIHPLTSDVAFFVDKNGKLVDADGLPAVPLAAAAPDELSLSPAVWLNLDNVTYANGDTVTTWEDSSGNGFHAVGASGQRPLYKTGGPGNRGYLQFDAVNDVMTTAADVFDSSWSGLTFLMVYKVNTQSDLSFLASDTVANDGFKVIRSRQSYTVKAGGGVQAYVPGQESTEWSLLAIRFDGTTRSVRIDGNNSYNLDTPGALGALGPLSIGGYPNTLYPSAASIAEVIVYRDAMDIDELDLVEAGLLAKYNLNRRKTVTFIGDSIMAGSYYTDDPWRTQFIRGVGVNEWVGATYSVSGEAANTSTQHTRALERIQPGDIVFYGLGSNDMNTLTAAATWALIQAQCLELQRAGARVILVNQLPRTDHADATLQTGLNTLQRAGWTSIANAWVDFGADPIMGPTAAAANATYYGDGVHPTAVGAARLALVAQDVFLKFLGKPRPVTLIDAATIATDCYRGNEFNVTLTDNRTLGTPDNPTSGQRCVWRLKQDATGSRTITLAAAFRAGPWTVTLTTTAAKTDYLECVYNAADSKWDVVNFQKGF